MKILTVLGASLMLALPACQTTRSPEVDRSDANGERIRLEASERHWSVFVTHGRHGYDGIGHPLAIATHTDTGRPTAFLLSQVVGLEPPLEDTSIPPGLPRPVAGALRCEVGHCYPVHVHASSTGVEVGVLEVQRSSNGLVPLFYYSQAWTVEDGARVCRSDLGEFASVTELHRDRSHVLVPIGLGTSGIRAFNVFSCLATAVQGRCLGTQAAGVASASDDRACDCVEVGSFEAPTVCHRPD